MGKAGGLLDSQADPGSVFLYRLEDREFLQKIGVDPTPYPAGPVPTIYQANLRDPSGFLLASRFQMRDKDVIFVANAKAVELVKFLNVARTIIAAARESNAAVREIGAP